MSYVYLGKPYQFAPYVIHVAFGAAPALTTATGLIADALKGASSDTSLSKYLSPQSKLMSLIQTTGIEKSIGNSLSSVAESVIQTLSDSAGAAAKSLIGDVGALVPFIGFAIDAIASMVASSAAEDAARKASAATYWQRRFEQGRVIGSGSGGKIVPADIFTPYLSPDGAYVSKGWSNFRPELGNQLIRITEGTYGGTYDKILEWARVLCGQFNIGVPPERRKLFRKLRMAIESQWIPPYGSAIQKSSARGMWEHGGSAFDSAQLPFPKSTVSDGGVSLWPLYMDMLAREVEEGHITPCMIGYFSNHDYLGGKVTQYQNRPSEYGPVWNMIMSWMSQVHPSYKQDVAEYNKIKAQVQDAIKGVTVGFTADVKAFAECMRKELDSKKAGGAYNPQRCTQLLSAKPKPKTTVKPAAKMSPAAAIAIGAGAAAVLALLVL